MKASKSTSKSASNVPVVLGLKPAEYRNVLSDYISFIELDTFTTHGELGEIQRDRIESLYYHLVSDHWFENTVQTKCLAIALSELLYQEEGKSRELDMNLAVRPEFTSGIEDLLSALNLYLEHPWNIEKVVFHVRNTPVSKEMDLKLVDRPSKETSKRLVSTGLDVISLLMESLGKKREEFEAINSRHKQMLHAKEQNPSTKARIRVRAAKNMAPVINQILQKECGLKESDATYHGALILLDLGYMPKLKESDLMIESKWKKKICDSFRSYAK